METLQRTQGATPACRPCTEPVRPVSAVTVALVVILAIIIICCLVRWLGGRGRQKEGFVTPRARELCDASRELFDRTRGGATYSEFKTSYGGADPVLYTDLRNLWKAGNLTPEAVQTIL